MANVLDIFKTNFGLSLRNNLLLTICYLLLIPIIRGTANLDAVRSAECLEQSVTLVIVPLNAPEQSKAIQEIIGTKEIAAMANPICTTNNGLGNTYYFDKYICRNNERK